MDFSIAAAGIQSADAAFDSAAGAVVQAFNRPSASGLGDSVDLSSAVAALLKAKVDFIASTQLAVVEGQLQQSTLSILA